MICPVCGNTNISELIELNYIGASTYKQNLEICPSCGLIYSKDKFPFEYNIMASNKDSYLKERIYDFLIPKLKTLNVNDLDFEMSHIKQGNCNTEAHNSISKRKTVQIVSERLEHEVDLRQTMEKLSKKQTNYIFIEVPVYDLLSKDSTNLFGYFIKSHNYYYSFYTIKTMMDKLGYSLLNFELLTGNGLHMPMVFPCILSLWEKALKTNMQIYFHSNINDYINDCKAVQDRINQKINELFFNDIPIAMWGTGNYAEKLIGMTVLQDKNIAKIYDGNKQKCGSKFHNAVITGFNKNDLDNGIVKKILIASNTATSEIKKMIIEKYSVPEEFLAII